MKERAAFSYSVWALLGDRRMLWVGWLAILLECIVALPLSRPWAAGDSFHYLALADNLARGAFASATANGLEPEVLRPPGYPLILTFFLHVLNLPIIAVLAAQLAACCASFYLIQKYLEKSGVSPVPYILLAAAYPFPVLYSAHVLGEAWVMLVTTAAALLSIRGTLRHAALAGGFAGLASLIRADMLLLPVVVSFVAAAHVHRQKRSTIAKHALVPMMTAAIVILPYTVWNFEESGTYSPSPLAGAVGTSLYLSTWQEKFTEDDVEALINHRLTPHIRALGVPKDFAAINRELGTPEVGVAFDPYNYPTRAKRIEAAHVFRRAALSRIAADPSAYLRHVIRNTWALWVTKRFPANIPWAIAWPLTVSTWLVFILGLTGICGSLVRSGQWPVPWHLALVTLYPAAIHVWLHTEARYTAATRQLLLLFAASVVTWICSRMMVRVRVDMADQSTAADRGPFPT